jgi:hypothetical protein
MSDGIAIAQGVDWLPACMANEGIGLACLVPRDVAALLRFASVRFAVARCC